MLLRLTLLALAATIAMAFPEKPHHGIGCKKNGFKKCQNACVDILTDVKHCGHCSIACGDGQTCDAGLCKDVRPACNAGQYTPNKGGCIEAICNYHVAVSDPIAITAGTDIADCMNQCIANQQCGIVTFDVGAKTCTMGIVGDVVAYDDNFDFGGYGSCGEDDDND